MSLDTVPAPGVDGRLFRSHASRNGLLHAVAQTRAEFPAAPAFAIAGNGIA